MKVLIVDDEELTRTGLVSSIDWDSLGIDDVLQADDGVKGLEMARLYRPEIILCDVRMPRMTGIAMLEEVKKILPDTVSIFMSGYSDKEYLKAAIKLKTINYIEKPLNPAEIQEAILAARELYCRNQHSRQGEELHSMQTISRLAFQLTAPHGGSPETVRELAAELGLHLDDDTGFAAVIFHIQAMSENVQFSFDSIYNHLNEFLSGTGLHCLCAEKRPQHIVFFILGDQDVLPSALDGACRFLCEQFAEFGRYLAAAGGIGTGPGAAYQSYSSAVILLQSSFFFPEGTLLTAEVLNRDGAASETKWTVPPESLFSKALSQADDAACSQFLNTLFQAFHCSRTQLPNQVRDLYYKLFLILEDTRRQQHIAGAETSDDGSNGTINIIEAIENTFTYEELHQVLTDRTHQFLKDIHTAAAENSTIAIIRDYISKNYMNELLSVKDISSHVFLSVSYVCTFFKNETGQTLNQYLTEYRMERAKELLRDPRYKISDVSSKVGYSDGNYFGKTFKKYTGFSPSEYREKMTR